MILATLTRVDLILNLISKINNLASGEFSEVPEIAGKKVYAAGSSVDWYYTSVSPYDENTAFNQNEYLGDATGNVFKSNRNVGNGLLYTQMKVKNPKFVNCLGSDCLNKLIWVQSQDISIEKKSQNIFPAVFAALAVGYVLLSE